ncbi:lactonase family protein [Zunongwangia sp.]|uniref:lactonase family protein n=1 Tax=Zunongwangia sp. TaxID=1965325 RepID=UPI003AA9D611
MSKFNWLWVLAFICLSVSGCKNNTKNEEKEKVAEKITTDSSDLNTAFIGTYTKKEGHVDGKADGIVTIQQNPKTGEITMGTTVAEVTNPSFVKLSEDNKYLYAVSELGENEAKSGFVYSYKVINKDSIIELNKVSTEGFAPCHIDIDKSGNYVFVSNYVGGVVMMYKIQKDGSLKEQQKIATSNPKKSHTHSLSISGDNKHAYICDLGLDKIWIYDLDFEKGKLTQNKQKSVSLEDGAGPRHFTFSKEGKFAYSMNELNSTISTFKVEDNGGLTLINSVSSIPQDFKGENSGADIHIGQSGEYLYGSNRGHNSIVIFKRDQESGKLTLVGFESTNGKTPRNFTITRNGKFLYAANQDSSTMQAYKIDQQTGKLEKIGSKLDVPTPVSIEFMN